MSAVTTDLYEARRLVEVYSDEVDSENKTTDLYLKLTPRAKLARAFKELDAECERLKKELNFSKNCTGVVVPREFLESAKCPSCDERDWYVNGFVVVGGKNSSDPEQEQCQWCFERNAMLAAAQERK